MKGGNTMKQILALILSVTMIFALTGCGSNDGQTGESGQAPVAQQEPSAADDAVNGASGGNVLVAYFSYGENAQLPDGVDASSSASIQPWNGGITGNTGLAAAMIAEATGADIFSIRTAEPYPDTYDETIDKGQEERNAGARPELADHLENAQDYDMIFLGFPNWWGDMPMAVYTFLEGTDLSGKTIIPFVTSGGSGFSGTIEAIEELQPEASVLEGLSISGSQAAQAQEQVGQWLDEVLQ